MYLRIQNGIVPHDQVSEFESIISSFATRDESFARQLIASMIDCKIEVGDDFISFPEIPLTPQIGITLAEIARELAPENTNAGSLLPIPLPDTATHVNLLLRFRKKEPAN